MQRNHWPPSLTTVVPAATSAQRRLVSPARNPRTTWAFWRVNLGYFDRYAVDTWPQNEIGVVLWSLSASAHDWLARETLTRLCASPVIGVLESQWDFGSIAMEFRI